MTNSIPQVLTVGRVSVDLYAQQSNANATNIDTFKKSVGGTSTNVAVAAALLGVEAATFTKVGDDEFGEYVRHALLETFNVDSRWIGTDPDLPTPPRIRDSRPTRRPAHHLLPRAVCAGSADPARRDPGRGHRAGSCSLDPRLAFPR